MKHPTFNQNLDMAAEFAWMTFSLILVLLPPVAIIVSLLMTASQIARIALKQHLNQSGIEMFVCITPGLNLLMASLGIVATVIMKLFKIK